MNHDVIHWLILTGRLAATGKPFCRPINHKLLQQHLEKQSASL
ncbi:MAG: hypothetical protein R8L53_06045 [Mariprofundales bacterium]